MADIVNLRLRRKQKARAAADEAATANRAKFGRPKAERTHDDAEATRARAELDHKKLTGPRSNE